jgi:hypothetical protein
MAADHERGEQVRPPLRELRQERRDRPELHAHQEEQDGRAREQAGYLGPAPGTSDPAADQATRPQLSEVDANLPGIPAG